MSGAPQAKPGPPVDEAAFAAALEAGAKEIADGISNGTITHPDGTRLLPDGYRLEWG